MARVLIVDDSEDLQDSYEMVLGSEGHEVIRAESGRRGLAALEKDPPDVVLLDMMMPDLDGLGFLDALSRLEKRPPVIANSGFDAYEEVALERGATAFLRKPVEPAQLLAAIASAEEHRAVSPAVLEANVAHVEEQRRRAAVASRELMRMIMPEDLQPLRHSLDALADWIPSYYGFGSSFIQLLRGDELFVEACGHAPSDWFAGKRYPRKLSYCDLVIDAGSTLLLENAPAHACRVFSEHDEARAGWRMYAGVPLTTSEGCVIGTLCLLDKEPHELHEEDMRLLEALGLNLAHAIEEVATGLPSEDFVVDEAALFNPEMLPVLVQVAVRRAARRGGAVELALVDLTSEDAATDSAAAVYCAALGPGLAVVRRGRRQLALVEDGEPTTLPRKLAAAVRACMEEGGVRAVGIGWTDPLVPSEIDREAAAAIQADLFRRAAHDRAEHIHHPTM